MKYPTVTWECNNIHPFAIGFDTTHIIRQWLGVGNIRLVANSFLGLQNSISAYYCMNIVSQLYCCSNVSGFMVAN